MARPTKTTKQGRTNSSNSKKPRIRYAVVGLGYIAQIAVLPAFSKARNCELAALVSDDNVKLEKLSRKYKVPATYSYEDFDECLNSGEIDAVYIALPNSMHRDYTVRASEAGIHVLCEKPLAVTESECEEMISAAANNGVKLMTAYRLHFEQANMKAVEIAQSGKLGDLRVFNSLFSMQVREGDIRLQEDLGGGTLYDIGIYCINAARYLFQDEPIEVVGFSANNGENRFKEVDEMFSAILRFPNERLASFTTSFGAADISAYQIVGTEGDLKVDPAYEFAADLKHRLTIKGKTRERSFPKRDQFAPELIYFADCVINDNEPEPSGKEGLADVRIIRALYRSAENGKPVSLDEFEKERRPTIEQEIHEPPVKKPELVRAATPSRED
ncbi:MAG TPA: Gfo/Idh/MocA family oxidoreductase [Blastocatellia bacterium]|nr:Gfo/Idh/MocA family oxidoreductase [Blastocatellia bacterium]